MAKLEVLDSGEVRTRLGASPIEWWTEDDGFGLLAVGVDGSLRAYAPSEAEAMLGGRLAHLTSYDGKLVIIIEPKRESPTKDQASSAWQSTLLRRAPTSLRRWMRRQ